MHSTIVLFAFLCSVSSLAAMDDGETPKPLVHTIPAQATEQVAQPPVQPTVPVVQPQMPTQQPLDEFVILVCPDGSRVRVERTTLAGSKNFAHLMQNNEITIQNEPHALINVLQNVSYVKHAQAQGLRGQALRKYLFDMNDSSAAETSYLVRSATAWGFLPDESILNDSNDSVAMQSNPFRAAAPVVKKSEKKSSK